MVNHWNIQKQNLRNTAQFSAYNDESMPIIIFGSQQILNQIAALKSQLGSFITTYLGDQKKIMSAFTDLQTSTLNEITAAKNAILAAQKSTDDGSVSAADAETIVAQLDAATAAFTPAPPVTPTPTA